MTNEELKQARDQHVPRGPFNVTNLFAAKAKNATITDVEGREYIDFAAGIGVMAVGHCHPKVVAAVQDQAASSRTPASTWSCTSPTSSWPRR